MEEKFIKNRQEKDLAILMGNFEPIRQKDIEILEHNIPIYEQNAETYKKYKDMFVGKIESEKRDIENKKAQIEREKGLFAAGTRRKLKNEIMLLEKDIAETEGWIRDYDGKYQKAVTDKQEAESTLKELKGVPSYDLVYREMLANKDPYAKFIYARNAYFSIINNEKLSSDKKKELLEKIYYQFTILKGKNENEVTFLILATRTRMAENGEWSALGVWTDALGVRIQLREIKENLLKDFPEYEKEHDNVMLLVDEHIKKETDWVYNHVSPVVGAISSCSFLSGTVCLKFGGTLCMYSGDTSKCPYC